MKNVHKSIRVQLVVCMTMGSIRRSQLTIGVTVCHQYTDRLRYTEKRKVLNDAHGRKRSVQHVHEN